VHEIEKAIDKIHPADVYKEKERIGHGLRALVNVIKNEVQDSKPYIHMGATSADIIDTADILRFKDATEKVIIPDTLELEKELIKLAEREKNTLQIGRTHGQHAVPITFGFAIAQYVDRLGNRILNIQETCDKLVGMFSGAVGAYNALSTYIESPEEFERLLLKELGLKPARISTQVIPPEPITDFIHALISGFGVLANLADDMRHLQRTEIDEVKEPFSSVQVGSSTMPQKQNPEIFESIKSLWKVAMPRMTSVYSDQISEHQRDLTNSASERYVPEILVIFDHSIRRMTKVMKSLTINKEKMRKNFELSADRITAEPLQILLSYYKHPNAHEIVRQLAMESIKTGKPFRDLVWENKELKPYLDKLQPNQKKLLLNSEKYYGIAPQKTQKVCNFWKRKLKIKI
jgi:adenylosuccinate lyase